MSDALEFALRAVSTGVGATIVLDIWSQAARRFGVTPSNWGMVGRWIGHMPGGRFIHNNIAAAPPIAGERAIGWSAHYVIGVFYAAVLLGIMGVGWARQPTLLPALIFGWATMAAPFFIMQPAMGGGIASSKAPNPNAARLKTLLSHTVYGLGLFATALVVSAILA